MSTPDPGKTMLRRIEQYHDRWTSYGGSSGVVVLSDKLTPEELARYDVFADYDEAFLERISPDVSLAVWEAGATLFEEGSYIDLAFVVVEGEIEVGVESLEQSADSIPLFDFRRTGTLRIDDVEGGGSSFTQVMSARTLAPLASTTARALQQQTKSNITLLAAMDFDLPRGSITRLGPREIFGEIGALSGWPQSVTARTATQATLLQIRVPALRLMKRKSPALKKRLDRLYRERSLANQLKATPLFRHFTPAAIAELNDVVELVSCEPGEIVVREGERADALYLVRSGFLKLMQRFGEDDLAVSYLSKGMTLGEVELLASGIDCWERTAISVEYAELVRIPAKTAKEIVRHHPHSEELLWQSAVARIKEAGLARRNIGTAEFTQVALETGLVQGSSMLVIDLNHCTRCDDCVRACAATHGGRPRFVREGDKYDNLLIAKSCYHCRDPVCLVGCPTGAIHRAGGDEVVEIDDSICIGCATCANNCPYDSIVMHDTGTVWPNDMVPVGLRGRERMVASKCDQCRDTGHGPACVSNCPQGCAYRIGSLQGFQELLGTEEGS